MSDEKELGEILSPDEIVKRRQRAKIEKEEKKENSTSIIEPHPSCVQIDYESMGKLSIPSTLYFRDYSTDNVNDIIFSKQEKLLETLVPIFNEMKHGNKDIDCAMMTPEDFIETLIAIKRQFNTKNHKHYWICDCQKQKNIPVDDQVVNENIIDLSQLKYRSLEDVEDILKKQLLDDFNQMSNEEWKEYLKIRYRDKKEIDINAITKEQIINEIKIKEPFEFYFNNHTIQFRFNRIIDIITAQKIVEKEYASIIKKIENRVEHGVPGQELKEKKQKELKEIEEQKAKKIIKYSKALSLISFDNKILNDQEKIELFNNAEIFPRKVTLDLDDFMEQLKFGVYDKKEFVCPLCGKTNKEDLHNAITPFEFLPFNASNDRDNRHLTRLNIRFGA